MTIEEFFQKYPRVAIAFSGGVDSAYLLYAAKKYAKEAAAYYVKSAFQPQFEFDDAKRLAKELSADMRIIHIDILSDRQIASNPKDRCYYCKKKIFSTIVEKAQKDGFEYLLDGTNASDEENDRPGMKALAELSVLSPLRMCGLTKDDIRVRSKEAGLFTWNKPSYACLATRTVTGEEINEILLSRTERAEDFLTTLGFEDFRVRTLEGGAKIQIRENQIELLMKNRKKILEALLKDYKFVHMDLEVRGE